MNSVILDDESKTKAAAAVDDARLTVGSQGIINGKGIKLASDAAATTQPSSFGRSTALDSIKTKKRNSIDDLRKHMTAARGAHSRTVMDDLLVGNSELKKAEVSLEQDFNTLDDSHRVNSLSALGFQQPKKIASNSTFSQRNGGGTNSKIHLPALSSAFKTSKNSEAHLLNNQ